MSIYQVLRLGLMWKWIVFNSAAIQAACAILGLLGLFWYAIETRSIRRATLAQSAAARRPYFTLKISREFPGCFITRNIGAGIALKAQWIFMGPESAMRPIDLGSCAVNQRKAFYYKNEVVTAALFISHGGVKVTYTDTAGVKYWSTFTPQNGIIVVDTGEDN